MSFKGSQLGAFCPYAMVNGYIEFKLRYLKNMKLFSIILEKRIIWAYSFAQKGDGFLHWLVKYVYDLISELCWLRFYPITENNQ